MQAGRTQVNYLASHKRERSRKPDETYHPDWPTYAGHSRSGRTMRLPSAAE